jgi:hypothetical protein
VDVLCDLQHIGKEFSQPSGGVIRVLEDVSLSVKDRLAEEGRAFLRASVPERKKLFREAVLQLRIVRDVLEKIRLAGGKLDDDVVLSTVALRLPYEDPERLLHTMVGWARNADLFDYDPERHLLFVDEPAAGSGG